MEKIIPVPVNERDFYLAYLNILKLFKPVSLLTDKEIILTSELMYYWNKYSSMIDHRGNTMTDKEISNLIFNTDIKQELRDKLEVSIEGMNNLLSSLRLKKDVLDKDNNLKSFYRVPTDNFNLIIKLQI